jgi:hypothetical protein
MDQYDEMIQSHKGDGPPTAAEINAELLAALKMAYRQNSCDMVLTGEELRRLEAAIAHAEGGAA